MLIKTLGELRELTKDLPDSAPVIIKYPSDTTPFIFPEAGHVEVYHSKDWGWQEAFDGMDEEAVVLKAIAFYRDGDWC